MSEDTFQPNKKCPKCKKRKVYVVATSDGYMYVCKNCGHTWKA